MGELQHVEQMEYLEQVKQRNEGQVFEQIEGRDCEADETSNVFGGEETGGASGYDFELDTMVRKEKKENHIKKLKFDLG